jgi:two-component system chemotaxis sensor kinase CheA
VPFDLVRETVHVDPASLSVVRGAHVVTIRERVVPLVWLRDTLDLGSTNAARRDTERLKLLLVQVGTGELGIVVDAFHEAVEIMLRPLEGPLSALRGYLGASLLGDGRALLVLNVGELVEQLVSGKASQPKERHYDHPL